MEKPPSGETTIEKNTTWLSEMVSKLGYRDVSSLDELELSEDQLKRLRYIVKPRNPEHAERLSAQMQRTHFYRAERPVDQRVIKAAVRIEPNDTFAADILSSVFPGGSASNNDFSKSELEQNLKFAIGKDK